MFDSAAVASIIVALLTGGALNAGLTHLRERKKDTQTGLADFYKEIWLAESKRLHAEIDDLRHMVVALSVELENLGGDPLRIRRCLRTQNLTTDPEEPPE